jgi:hypothetical protein
VLSKNFPILLLKKNEDKICWRKKKKVVAISRIAKGPKFGHSSCNAILQAQVGHQRGEPYMPFKEFT